MLIGHKEIVGLFESLLKNNGLNKSYCFVGPEQVGKRTLAFELSSKLLNVAEKNLTNHPDFFYIERVVGDEEQKSKKNISIEQIRQLKQRLQNSSWGGSYRSVVIDGAEFLNEEASNALLKFLEEPPAKTVVFLLTTDEKSLLSTVRSRLEMVYFNSVSEQEIVQHLKENNISELEAQKLADASWGSPGRAIDFLQINDLYEKYEKEVERFKMLLGQPFYVKLKALEEIFGKEDKDDHIKSRERLIDILNIWEMEWRKIILGKSPKSIDMNMDKEKIISLIDNIHEARKLLRQNIHPRLLIENLVLDF
jgi:DNA polymerase-3 subunit delta'